jgi:hypothetical protein
MPVSKTSRYSAISPPPKRNQLMPVINTARPSQPGD